MPLKTLVNLHESAAPVRHGSTATRKKMLKKLGQKIMFLFIGSKIASHLARVDVIYKVSSLYIKLQNVTRMPVKRRMRIAIFCGPKRMSMRSGCPPTQGFRRDTIDRKLIGDGMKAMAAATRSEDETICVDQQ